MQLWKKSLAALTAGVLCLGGIGVSGSLNMPGSVGVLSASAEEGTYGSLSYDVINAGEIELPDAIWMLHLSKFRQRLPGNV